MKKKPNILIFISGAGAELTWLYAWAFFLLFSFFQRLYPLPETLGTFSLAAFLMLVHRRRRWRVIQIIGLQLIGLACTGLWVVYVFYYSSVPLWNTDWLTDFFKRPRDQLDWFLLIFVLGHTIVFWATGIRFAVQVKSYFSACTRFDRGVTAFFCLFLIKLVLQTRMGVQFHDSMTIWLIFPFFIFSLTEMGLTRKQGRAQHKDYLSGYYAVGVFAGFSMGALILGTAVFLFCLPYLKATSLVGYDLMKSAAGPLTPILIAVIKFIFGYAKFSPQDPGLSPATGAAGSIDPDEPGAWMLFAQKALMWGGGLLLLTLGIAAACLVFWYLIRWLFKKPAGGEETGDQWGLLSWWGHFKSWLYICREWILRTRTRQRAFQFYAALLRWGRYSGLPQASYETPLEYGSRLASRFPKLKTEILLIVEMLHWEVYGECSLSTRQIARTREAWKKLHSPLRWPFRIKSIFVKS